MPDVFQVGDLVHLLSGGPVLTVYRVQFSKIDAIAYVGVMWFTSDDQLKSDTLPARVLKKASM